jgi:AcrR family transcriptional regulator
MKREDLRIRYTRMIFRDSLIELMKKQPISKIGIKEICALAGVSRSTFYTHYKDVYDLLEQIEDETLVYFEDIVNQHVTQMKLVNSKEKAAMFQRNLQYIADNSNSVQVLLSENGNIRFQEKFFKKFIAYAQNILLSNSDNPSEGNIYEGYSVFVVHGAIGLVQYWLRNNMFIPIPEMAKMLVKLMAGIEKQTYGG